MPAPANRPGYDKAGSVLRVETTINDAARFKSYRSPEGKPNAAKAWHPMAKGIGELHRRAEVSRASNTRYLQALASVENTTSLAHWLPECANHRSIAIGGCVRSIHTRHRTPSC